MSEPHSENENPISRIMVEALTIKNLDERENYLKRETAGDESLLNEVKSLLNFAEGLEDYRERPRDFVGETIGKYKILNRIGQGGMGTVYRAARIQDFSQTVAIKIINKNMLSEDGIRRFGKEMRIMARLNHPNLARLIDGGTFEDDLPYVIMEYIEGQNIIPYCDLNKLTIRERLSLFLKVCTVTSFAHKADIVHRDIKPGNILVTANGEPKLIDFGIAKILNPAYDAESFLTGTFSEEPCSPEYSSPEQIRGDSGIGIATDVYSLGAVLYELLSGHRPHRFRNYSREEVRKVVCEGEIVRPSQAIGEGGAPAQRSNDASPESISTARGCLPQHLRQQLSGSLDSVVLKALRKEPRNRYESVDALALDIENHLHGRNVAAGKKAWGKEIRNFGAMIGNNLPPTKLNLKPKLAIYSLLIIAFAAWKFIPKIRPSPAPPEIAEVSVRLPPIRPNSLAATLPLVDQAKLRQAIVELSRNISSHLSRREPWELSQMIVGSKDIVTFDIDEAHRTFRDLVTPKHYCRWNNEAHLGASGWSILAVLRLNVAVEQDLKNQVDFVVIQQRDGWWPLYPLTTNISEVPSTYATAYSVLALHQYLTVGTTPARLQNIPDAVLKGQNWLLGSREDIASWKDAPGYSGAKSSIGLNGLVIHVLHRTKANPKELKQIESYWRQHLPQDLSNPGERYQSGVYANGQLVEDTHHIAMPWAIIATADTYAGGTAAEQKEAAAWIKKVIEAIDKNRLDPENTIVKGEPYIKAELLIALRYLMGDEIL